MYPKCAWLVDQAFTFMQETLIAKHGLDLTTSSIAVLFLILVCSFVPMIVFNYLLGSLSFRSKKHW